jgi:hypothetical protein
MTTAFDSHRDTRAIDDLADPEATARMDCGEETGS